MHDATSLLITDARTAQCGVGHNPCEVYVDFNENTVDLWDVTDKARADPAVFDDLFGCELHAFRLADRRPAAHLRARRDRGDQPRPVHADLHDERGRPAAIPSSSASYQGPDTTTDHNGYTKGNFLYVSHYRRGLVVFDASDPERLREVASFDTFLAPAANSAGTDGAWGVYPFFPSGTVVISDISNGLFVLRDQAATLAQNAGRIAYAGMSAQVAESSADARVIVRRNGGTAGAVSIDYATSDLSATAGNDYTATTGTLNWAAGDMTDRTITIPVTNDTETSPMRHSG